MIKVDYEGAWKELKGEYGGELSLMEKGHDVFLYSFMIDMEQKHTHDIIELQKRSDKEIADYCMKKHAEVYLGLVCLKQKLRKLSKRGK